jgi:hypothetical protein
MTFSANTPTGKMDVAAKRADHVSSPRCPRQPMMPNAPRMIGDRLLFSCRMEVVADRPDIMSARALEMTAVRDTDIAFLRGNPNLRVLYLVEAQTLQGIAALPQIRELVLLHIPKVRSLEPLAALRDLEVLTISTPPSWDASRRCIEVDSLDPLKKLAGLIALSLTGVRPLHGGLRPLRELKGLRRLEVSHVYDFGLEDYAELAAHLPSTAGACLQPCFSMGFAMPCRKCGRQTVFLTGPRPRTRRYLCVVCDRSRLEEHIARWNTASGGVFPYPATADEVALLPPVHYAEAQ